MTSPVSVDDALPKVVDDTTVEDLEDEEDKDVEEEDRDVVPVACVVAEEVVSELVPGFGGASPS